jgi:cell division septation protein DedD
MQYDALIKAMDIPNAEAFSSPSIQQDLPDRYEPESEPKNPNMVQSENGSSVELAKATSRKNTTSIPAINLISTPIPDSKEPIAKGIKRGENTPEQSMPSRVIVERPSAVVYSIHLESYRAANNVNIRVDFFKSLGLQAFSRCVVLPEKGIWHRVLVGTFDSRNQARKYQVQIQEVLSIAESRIIALPPEPKRPS